MFNNRQQIRRTYAMSFLIGGVFLACSLLLLRQVSHQSEQENALYLYDTTNQVRALLQRQITLDFQTLRGVAITLGHVPREDVYPILKEVNDNNEFIRMGLAAPDGRVDMLDINGSVHRNMDLSGEAFFQAALKGQAALSTPRKDRFGPGWVIYCAVPVDREAQNFGVLVGVNDAALFQHILNIPLAEGKGISAMINAEGRYVLGSDANAAVGNGDIFSLGPVKEKMRAKALDDLAAGRRGFFFFTHDNETFFAAYEPLSVNNWFLFYAVPSTALALVPNALLYSVAGIIALALLLFFFLIWRVHSLGDKHGRELERLAFVDPLTGGRNANRLKLDAAALLRRYPNTVFAVWYADIKNFKFYNEMFGYEMGDKELVRIGGLLEEGDSPLSLCCRVSADKFAGIRPMSSREEFMAEFHSLARRIENDVARPSRAFPLKLHVGVYSTDMPQTSEISFKEMINRANIALRVAKENSAGGCLFYSEDMRGLALRLLDLEARMDTALSRGEFEIFFQPKVNIQQGNRIHGAEGLVRWRSGGRLIPPMEFIPLFERNGFIIELDRHMFALACAWLRKHLDSGRPPLNIAVNVSRLGLMQEDFLRYYTTVKERYAIPDGLLELECTESLALFDERFRELVLELKKRGFLCSLDDFGAGFSSLNVLKDLPIDVLKLDILFLRKSRDLKRERIVISNVITMARELGIRTVSEGVESVEQVEFLRSKGCDLVQGYVFAKPMPAADFDALLARLDGGPLPYAQS